ncbi:MAG: hypothetical protein ACRDFW_02120 [bacterium]
MTEYGLNMAEETRVMQQINSTAQRLHQLWSAPTEDADQFRRHAQLVSLQAEMDRLYERRRAFQAARRLLEDAPSRRSAAA